MTDTHNILGFDHRVVYLKNPKALDRFKDCFPEPFLYIDLETHGHEGDSALNVRTCRPRLMTITGQDGLVLIIDLMFVPVELTFPLLASKVLIGHNLGYDLPILVRCGLPWPETVRDTMLASQVLLAGIKDHEGHGLGACMDRFLDRKVSKELGSSKWEIPELTKEQLEYAANDVIYLRDLFPYLMSRLEKYELTPTFELECDFLHTIVSMALNGVAIDAEQWTRRAEAAAVKAKVSEQKLRELLPLPDEKPVPEIKYTKKGEPSVVSVRVREKVIQENLNRKWNFGSWQQIIAAFDKIGITLPDTSYETLVELRGEHPIIDTLIDYREWEKESGGTFGVEWLKHVDSRTGRVYPRWWQLGTDSGRMSCSDPNLQQVKRGEMRKGIIAPEGCLLVRADFSQIEARVAALISGDEVLSRLFIENQFDIHRYVASKVLVKDVSEVTKEERQIGKSLLFGLLFGMQTDSLIVYCRTQYGVRMTLSEGEEYRARFFAEFWGLNEWHQRTRKVAYKQTDFRTLSGRRRYIAEGVEVNRQGVALNHRVQGTAADLLKMSCVELWRRRNEFPEASFNALIHDEIMLSVRDDKAQEAGVWLKSVMCDVGNKLIAPIPVDAEVKIGRSWGG